MIFNFLLKEMAGAVNARLFVFSIQKQTKGLLIMRKLHWLFMVVCLAVMPALQSCDDNDGYSIGDFTRRCELRCVSPEMLSIWTVMCGERFGL